MDADSRSKLSAREHKMKSEKAIKKLVLDAIKHQPKKGSGIHLYWKGYYDALMEALEYESIIQPKTGKFMGIRRKKK